MNSTAELKTSYRDRLSRRPQLTFPEILGDPLVRAMMRADRVDTAALKADLGRIASKLKAAPPRAAVEPCLAC